MLQDPLYTSTQRCTEDNNDSIVVSVINQKLLGTKLVFNILYSNNYFSPLLFIKNAKIKATLEAVTKKTQCYMIRWFLFFLPLVVPGIGPRVSCMDGFFYDSKAIPMLTLKFTLILNSFDLYNLSLDYFFLLLCKSYNSF